MTLEWSRPKKYYGKDKEKRLSDKNPCQVSKLQTKQPPREKKEKK